MYLQSLTLQNFRSYSQASFSFSPTTNLILGQNGTGKSNLLEAIYLLSVGKSFRSVSLPKLISWEQPFSSIQIQLFNSHDNPALELQLIKNPESFTVSRKYFIDQALKTRKIFSGVLKTVVFSPQDIRLVTGSPSRRREFLDSVFSPIEWRYSEAIYQYHKALVHRNELLNQVRQGKNSPSELFYWDQSLAKNDDIVHSHRSTFVSFVNRFFALHTHPEIKKLSLNYHLSPLTLAILKKNYTRDLAKGYTQSGNHRDDFSFDSLIFPGLDKNLANWGSRGQQRLSVLALRLAQITFIKHLQKQNPVL
ncbi:DNA replication and repair protein RecF, partial [Patescibacteria group bacterium]|nr:DNA replication and repair protein RecF [Patescibacteria group bacterium]